MPRLGRLASGAVIALLTLGAVVVVLFTSGGSMFSPGALNARGHTGVTRGGVHSHADLGGNCAACHVPPWGGETMATRCLVCHTEVGDQFAAHHPLHGMLSEGTQCRSCHTEHNGAGGALTSLARFDHDLAAFKLTGKHQAVDCQTCHAGNVFKGTPQTCASCHAEPQVHKGKFGTDCIQCHSTAAWGGVSLQAGKFNHDLAGFKLTGKHQAVDCKGCHANNVFKGTPQTCASCHAEPQVHKGKFGTDCAGCHSTTKWEGAAFKHTFPLNHGNRRRTIDCATCHTTPDNFTMYTCYGCHEHEKARMERRHAGRRIANLDQCARCHATGREHGHLPGGEEDSRLAFLSACPEGCDFVLPCPDRGRLLRLRDADDPSPDGKDLSRRLTLLFPSLQ
jgi:hypothetical protein